MFAGMACDSTRYLSAALGILYLSFFGTEFRLSFVAFVGGFPTCREVGDFF
jgi:hypothetical protein